RLSAEEAAMTATNRSSGIEADHLCQGQVAGLAIEIHHILWRCDHVCTCSDRHTNAIASLPRLHHGAIGCAAIEDLIPADHRATTFRQPAGYARHHPTLQLTFAAESLTCDDCLTFVALAPARGGHLVATEVDEPGREQVEHFGQDRLDELEGALGGAEHICEHAPGRRHRQGIAGATKVRVGSDCGTRVAGNLDLRHHHDSQPAGVLDHSTHVCL